MNITRRMILTTPFVLNNKPVVPVSGRLLHGKICTSTEFNEIIRKKQINYETHKMFFTEAGKYYNSLLSENNFIVPLQNMRIIVESNPEYEEFLDDMIKDSIEYKMFRECFDM